MSIIIRLQNLPIEANSLDIRRYFHGLQIPDGGVHIVGGEKGDAFIAFGSDEDARQAMERDCEMIKDCRIKLLLSSRNEMQRVIENARNQTLLLKSPIDNTSIASNNTNAGFIGSKHINVPSELKSDDLRFRGRSPDRRQTQRQRSMERDRIMRNRSRSRSPFHKDINGNSGIDKMGPLQSNAITMSTMNVRDAPVTSSSFAQVPNVRSRLGYAEVIPPTGMSGITGMQDNDRSMSRSTGQWVVRNDPPFDTRRQTVPIDTSNRIVIGAGDYDRVPVPERFQSVGVSNLITNQALVNDRSLTVELRNLPFTLMPRDLMDFFHGLFIPEENIKILIDDRGRTTGGALVRFTAERDFEIALGMNGKFLGGRQITVSALIEPVSAERSDILMRQRSSLQSNSLVNAPLLSRDNIPKNYVLYMKGLPFNQCTERDVADFFGGIHILDIVIESDPRGKPLGNAFVEFGNSRDYDEAIQLNMKHMGRRYIELIPSAKEDMNEARRVLLPDDRSNDIPKQTLCVNITNLPPTVTNRDLTNYFVEYGAQPYAIHIMLKPNGLNAGEAYVEFATMEQQFMALRRDGAFMGPNRIIVKPVPFELMRNVVGKPPDSLPTQDNPVRPLPHQRYARSASGRGEDHGRSGNNRPEFGYKRDREKEDKRYNSVVIASNIPYRASTEDICVFFSDFGITEQSVSRRYNEKGQPTADAKITFRNPEEASRAVRMMNKKFLIGRPVLLKHA